MEINNNSKDLDLVKILKTYDHKSMIYSKASEILFKRYERQIHKNWWRFKSCINSEYISNLLKEDFYNDAYEAFVVSINKVDLNKIENDKWKLVGYFDFYLRNVRNKMIKEAFKRMREIPLEYSSDEYDVNENRPSLLNDAEISNWEDTGYLKSPENVILQKEKEAYYKSIINRCYIKWSTEKKLAFKGLMLGLSGEEISQEINKDVHHVYSLISRIKKDLRKEKTKLAY